MGEEGVPKALHPLSTIEEVPSNVASSEPSPKIAMGNEDSDEEVFVYPGVERVGNGGEDNEVAARLTLEHPEELVEVFSHSSMKDRVGTDQQSNSEVSLPTLPSSELVTKLELPSVPDAPRSEVATYPAITVIPPSSLQAPPPKSHPTPAQLEAIQAAASNGDLSKLQELFRTALQAGDFEHFALANDASPRTGLTALHAAASRGHLELVRWRTFVACWQARR
ncbi:hypothetical protein BDY19DRAFT_569176 [Irpex rosettiformis]|uniref:Uncharacterized protein n=1 Tax=Irpex rosettiformis TaxID=378272 RepID=A0ACB8UCG7_9APHY|nr:hypothetical protein BDY19DRAFT_569176 [Irpex rosettiformis]